MHNNDRNVKYKPAEKQSCPAPHKDATVSQLSPKLEHTCTNCVLCSLWHTMHDAVETEPWASTRLYHHSPDTAWALNLPHLTYIQLPHHRQSVMSFMWWHAWQMCVYVHVCRSLEKQTDGHTDRWTYRQMDIQTDGHTDGQTYRQMDIPMDGHTDGWTYTWMNIYTCRWTDIQTDGHTDRWTYEHQVSPLPFYTVQGVERLEGLGHWCKHQQRMEQVIKAPTIAAGNMAEIGYNDYI